MYLKNNINSKKFYFRDNMIIKITVIIHKFYITFNLAKEINVLEIILNILFEVLKFTLLICLYIDYISYFLTIIYRLTLNTLDKS